MASAALFGAEFGRQGMEESESVQLFLDRATAIAPDFALTEQSAEALIEICRRLDGMPLAIELAAARVDVLSLEQIAERLDDRFRLLTVGRRLGLPRHQTLAAAIDWSYQLLSSREALLWCRLSVFSGSWSLEAAETVCAGGPLAATEILDLLSGLVQKSLLSLNHTRPRRATGCSKHSGNTRPRSWRSRTRRQQLAEGTSSGAWRSHAWPRCR